ncbi:MAG: hypothetical protein APF81_26720 [Desulfosporosinus sp. BRH_c37]|nr:MAG: hypothetical protein APF81_26720 [Desulfosporosinus sp. BRH_c37]
MNIWLGFSLGYSVLAISTLIRTLLAVFKKIELNPGGSSFDESPHFSDQAKKILIQHYSRIQGTLGFWKNQAEKYKRFHYYCMYWTIPASIMIPIITQWIDGQPYSKWLPTIISTHTAILIAFHNGFKVDKNFKSFRHGESDYYDLNRRLLDRPETFGKTEDERLNNYFREVEIVRRFVRNAETDNLPMVEDVKNNTIAK